jgi:hypothetical protein
LPTSLTGHLPGNAACQIKQTVASYAATDVALTSLLRRVDEQ